MKPIEEMTLIEKVVLLRELLCSVAENPQFQIEAPHQHHEPCCF